MKVDRKKPFKVLVLFFYKYSSASLNSAKQGPVRN